MTFYKTVKCSCRSSFYPHDGSVCPCRLIGSFVSAQHSGSCQALWRRSEFCTKQKYVHANDLYVCSQLALTHSPPESEVFVFTDASPKDAYLFDAVKALALEKRSKVGSTLKKRLLKNFQQWKRYCTEPVHLNWLYIKKINKKSIIIKFVF